MSSDIGDVRRHAKEFEATLDAGRRKHLGQFFTGLPLGRLLAAIALRSDASTVLDPMAGHGDLLDAVLERAARRGQKLSVIQGVEIDEGAAKVCRERLAAYAERYPGAVRNVSHRDAFDPRSAGKYLTGGYDLVITNPPYVRYQTLAPNNGGVHSAPKRIRENLRAIVASRTPEPEAPVWLKLVDGYSGLADLSIPAWILAASLVRPGGVLALVAPATWRSRDYGDVIEYLLARCFTIEHVVEDTQPGWFSDALVRTHLVIARRNQTAEVQTSLVNRPPSDATFTLVSINPEASDGESLVGAAFSGDDPEDEFAENLNSANSREFTREGIRAAVRRLTASNDQILASIARGRTWWRGLEPISGGDSLFASSNARQRVMVPEQLASLLGRAQNVNLCLPENLGIHIGQGLRTGCNDFFYVELIEELPARMARIRLAPFFESEMLTVPSECLLPAIRRQSELDEGNTGQSGPSRVLDLRAWVLPEDFEEAEQSRHVYAEARQPMPKVMPPELAGFVRRAAIARYGASADAKPIPELSAVRTNARAATPTRTPRFWYMLPDFARRHRPDAFIPRINQGIPVAEANAEGIIIDANFSTMWSAASGLSPHALSALFNTWWCRASMECLGTPLGGGALKLEATHLRRMPMPVLSEADVDQFSEYRGRELEGSPSDHVDRVVLGRIVGLDYRSATITQLIEGLQTTATEMCRNRQRRRL